MKTNDFIIRVSGCDVHIKTDYYPNKRQNIILILNRAELALYTLPLTSGAKQT